jgi:hypothetical protein
MIHLTELTLHVVVLESGGFDMFTLKIGPAKVSWDHGQYKDLATYILVTNMTSRDIEQ